LLGTKHIKHVDVVKPVQDSDMSTLKILSYTVLPMFIFGILGYMLPGNFLGSDTNDAFIIGCLPVIAFFIYLAFTGDAKESRAIKALLAVFACVILFFAIFHQNGDALTVWAEDHTDREMSAGVGYGVSIVSVAFTIFMNFLELLVAFLQAYVFTLLASLYFGSALEEHHHEEAHH
jgi:POT family proton-dependent oligopeptide transporter